MSSTRPNKEAQRRLLALVDEMSGESDRAAAMVGVEWVEAALTGAIRIYLEDHPEASNRLFDQSGPLAAFATKIDLGRLLGLMTDSIHLDLHSLRRIRNEFAQLVAHKKVRARLTFGSGRVRGRCLELRCVLREKHTNPRTAFTRACAVLNSDFDLVRLYGAKIGENARVFARGVDDVRAVDPKARLPVGQHDAGARRG